MGDAEREAAGSRRGRDVAIAWGLVAVQAALIIAILLVPVGDAWPVPPALAAASTALTWVGLGLLIWAIAVFGRGVTPSPLPSQKARLRTRGPYRWMRHPMYTGVIMLLAGAMLDRRSWLAAALWVALVGFLAFKAHWEEQRLVESYPGYADYREAVAAFVPLPGRAQG
jgi:protein-S-isoprenylcysteine O-methyltransferase Ste14